MGETREMHKVATRRDSAIELTSTAVKGFIKTRARLLRYGVDCLTPGVTQLDAVEDPGSIDEIVGDFCGSSIHIDERIRRLGRSTIYQICRHLSDIQVHLEKCHQAICNWKETERKTYCKWRSIDLNDLDG